MSYLPQSIENIARIGGSVSINAENMLPQSVENIARICSGSGAHLTVRNASKYLPQSLENIARIGKNQVTFIID